ncbi:glucokinase [Asticcacaulis sp. EMRT-3]|uniref:glucokinase n=1 Tax=Asticcacaulis sp. EMRT-3 TaxID=3040349 RepID=UPI0024AEF105|nr:glucokinase [Asticcacaulis sp. EMRT-3]MDI7775107.1 glucokinase [Asticcacaulis sp. EMRT-3]
MTLALLCDLSQAPDIALALAVPGRRPETVERFQAANWADFASAVKAWLAGQGDPELMAAAVSARGWEQKGDLHLVGVDFRIDRDMMRELLGIQRVNFLNNFVARALAVPRLRRDERQQISGGEVNDEHALVVMGPHHGLGLAALVSDGFGGWTALHGEGGHSDMPVKTEREWRIIEAVRAQTGYVSRESCISVAGLKAIWQALHRLEGRPAPDMTPAAILDAARRGEATARETLDIMTGFLAGMAGDVALIMGASGGVYLTGALLDMIGDQFDTELFCRHYLDKGPRAAYVREIPVFRTLAADMELSGLATLFE